MSNTDFHDDSLDTEQTIVIDQERDLEAISVIEKKLDGAIEIKDTIQDTRAIIENNVEETGLNKTSIELLNVAIESMVSPLKRDPDYSKVEIKSTKRISVENLDYRRERDIGVQISLENMQNHWRSFWLWIVEKIKKMVKIMREFYQKNTLMIEALIRRIDRVERYGKGVSISSDVKQIKNDSIAHGLSIKGRVPVDLRNHLDYLLMLTKSVLSTDAATTVQRTTEALKRYANNPTSNIKSEISNLLSPPLHVSKVGDIENTNITRFESRDILGNRRLVFYGIADKDWSEEQLIKDLPQFGGKLEYFEPVIQPTNVVPVLSVIELKAILGKAREIAIVVRDYKQSLEGVFRALDNLTMFASTVANRKPSEGRENRIKDKLIQDLAIKIPKLSQQPALSFISYASNVARLTTFYVETCFHLNNRK